MAAVERARRVRAWSVAACGLVLLLAAGAGLAQDFRFFRIGTGSIGGTYFPIGRLLATAISAPPGGPSCEAGGSCGVPGLIAAAQATGGSVDNVEAIAAGEVESGFSQADVAYWAFSGAEMFAGEPPLTSLRSIARLYTEVIHLVVAADSGIRSIDDLPGRRVSLGIEGSGTLIDAHLLLRAFGVDPSTVENVEIGPDMAGDLIERGELDGFLFVGGAPVLAVQDLARRTPIRLVPVAGPEVEAMLAEHSFFTPAVIEAGSYPGQETDVPTVGVGALWLVSADIDEETVHGIAAALWHDTTRALLDDGHPRGRDIRLEEALRGLAVPLHEGAARYYREIGLLRTVGEEPPAGD